MYCPRFEINVVGVVGDGKSAYELAVDQGFEGTLEEWLALFGPGAGNIDGGAPDTVFPDDN